MSNTFKADSQYALVLGDLGPPLAVQLMTSSNGAAAVPFVLQDTDAVTLRYLVPGDTTEHEVSMVIVDAPTGQVARHWSGVAGAVGSDCPAKGLYKGLVCVTRDGEDFPQTFPNFNGGTIVWPVLDPLGVGTVEPASETYVNDNAGTIVQLAPVYQTTSGHCDLAANDTQAHATVVGLVLDASIASGQSGRVQTSGVVVAPTSAWDAVTGGSGGLAEGAVYYVGAAGLLTTTPSTTTGSYPAVVGLAESSTMFQFAPQLPRAVGDLADSPMLVGKAGQSNGDGHGDAATLGGGWLQPFPGVKLYDQSAPVATLPLLWRNTVGDLLPYGLPGGSNSGDELALGKRLFASGLKKLDIVKYCVGGTSLAVDWNPTGTYPSASPNLFTTFVAYYQSVIAATGKPLKAIEWDQWEQDATDPTMSANYGANLTAFVAAVRTALGLPTLAFVIIGANTNSANSLSAPSGITAQNIATIQAAQAAFVASDQSSALVYTSDLTSVTTSAGGVHRNAADQWVVGERSAAAMLPFLGGSVSPVSRDSLALWYWPATPTEWTTFLAGIAGNPQPPNSNYLFANISGQGGLDSNGVQNLTVHSNWSWAIPSFQSAWAATTADGNTQSIASTAGPVGSPQTESELAIMLVNFTGVPSAGHDVLGLGGGNAFRSIRVTPAAGFAQIQLFDITGGNSPIGTGVYGTTWHVVVLQINRTAGKTQIVTDREVIVQSPYNAPSPTGSSVLLALGDGAAASGPMQVSRLGTWRGANAEISTATIQEIIRRVIQGLKAWES